MTALFHSQSTLVQDTLHSYAKPDIGGCRGVGIAVQRILNFKEICSWAFLMHTCKALIPSDIDAHPCYITVQVIHNRWDNTWNDMLELPEATCNGQSCWNDWYLLYRLQRRRQCIRPTGIPGDLRKSSQLRADYKKSKPGGQKRCSMPEACQTEGAFCYHKQSMPLVHTVPLVHSESPRHAEEKQDATTAFNSDNEEKNNQTSQQQ